MSRKVVVVAGASSGFGKLTVLELARRDHTVVATMRDVEGRNAKVRSELIDAAKAEGHVLHVLEMDVADEASVNSAIEQVIRQHGKIDALINNAGTMAVGVTEAWSRTSNGNLRSISLAPYGPTAPYYRTCVPPAADFSFM